jgi:hypothetical protein
MAPPPLPAATGAPDASCAAMLHSIRSLASYSDTLTDFLDQWNSVLHDVASIAATLAAHTPGPESVPPNKSAPEPSSAPAPELEPEPEPDPTKPSPNNPERGRRDGDRAAASEMGLLCEKMSARDLRCFLAARLPDREWLRLVGPDALLRAPDPAALVLRAVGRYYICAESRDAEAACLLLLELYVRAGCPRRLGNAQREAQLQEEVREAALSWRSRLVRVSGRVGAAGAREARGLTLFMAAYGVPVEFPPQEMYDLLAAGDSLSCTKVLRCSKLFVKTMRGEAPLPLPFKLTLPVPPRFKISPLPTAFFTPHRNSVSPADVVVELLNKDMYLQAIRIILAFEFQNAFPLAPTLTHIMEKVGNSRKKEGEELPSVRCCLAILHDLQDSVSTLVNYYLHYCVLHSVANVMS